MRYGKILLLHFEHVLEYRGRAFVWFLSAIINPLVFLLFWLGTNSGVDFNQTVSYYFLLIVASSLLTVHIEEDVWRIDIAEGELVKYLLRPISYFKMKFLQELPYRLLESVYGLFVFAVLFFFFRNIIVLTTDGTTIVLSIVITILAFLLSFVFKMIVGIVAFWIIDIGGFQQLVEIVLLLFGGYVLPLALLPWGMDKVSYILPFGYMIYFPIISFLGQLSVSELFRVIGMQLLWIFVLYLIYRKLWSAGIKQFTAVGQ